MPTTKPLFANAQIRRAEGRFPIQLEIPEDSQLSERDIERILELSSWSVDVPHYIAGIEGGRSVLIHREHPIRKNGMVLGDLQISGIGYRPFEVKGNTLVIQQVNDFLPPSSENAMDLFNGAVMTTTRAVANGFKDSTPKYRALGTYTHEELQQKLKGTIKADSLGLTKCVVPHVEAYGYFLNEDLSYQGNPFGFVVFPVPRAERSYDTIKEAVTSLLPGDIIDPSLRLIMEGLRELHDEGYVHLHPHVSNVYIVDEKVYLADWSSVREIGQRQKEESRNRAIDIMNPMRGYYTIWKNLGVIASDGQLTSHAARHGLEAYLGKPYTGKEKFCPIDDIRTIEKLGKIIQQGLERS